MPKLQLIKVIQFPMQKTEYPSLWHLIMVCTKPANCSSDLYKHVSCKHGLKSETGITAFPLIRAEKNKALRMSRPQLYVTLTPLPPASKPANQSTVAMYRRGEDYIF